MHRQAVLFELSGEHPTLPVAEALACLRAEAPDHLVLGSGPGYLVAELDTERIHRTADRLALTHRLGKYLGSAPLSAVEEVVPRLDLPSGSLCVRAKKVGEQSPETDTFLLAKRIGKVLSADHDIDLNAPEVSLRMLISGDVHFFLNEREIDRKQFDRRKVAERPFFSPISLHPRYARALVNLTQARAGDTVLDPFCGTGGIVLEAALLGMKAIGSDIDPDMVEGCRRNLEHFGVSACVEVSDIGDIGDRFGPVDAVATDPPYGRAASTGKEEIECLYLRGLRSMAEAVAPGGRVVVVLPREISNPGLELLDMHHQRVHRSLTRHYHVFIRQ